MTESLATNRQAQAVTSSPEVIACSSNYVAWAKAIGWSMIATGCLVLAYLPNQYAGFLCVPYLYALVQLARADTWRKAFYAGLATGLAASASRLGVFWTIFGPGALALWTVYAIWIGLFVLMARTCLNMSWPARFYVKPICAPDRHAWCVYLLIPCLWCGFEYFRSELYYLKFSWLNIGFGFGLNPSAVPLHLLGGYGVGFLAAALACLAALPWKGANAYSLGALILGMVLLRGFSLLGQEARENPAVTPVKIAGAQMEFPTETEVIAKLNELKRTFPEAELLVLSEYTFMEPIPRRVLDWCRQHKRHLIVGGESPAPGKNYFDTAFVVSPEGQIVFSQAKSVPIQFFKDGLPAPEQKLWVSPWGKIGICVCYDLSYSRVTDRLVRMGAQALVVPTMDVVDWGKSQHEMHARVAPVRASEYGIPVLRVASSGISQLVDERGDVQAAAPCPGEGATLSGILNLRQPGRLPLDRWLAPFCTAVTAMVILISIWNHSRSWFGRQMNRVSRAGAC